MKTTPTLLLSAAILCGCSKEPLPAPAATNDYVLRLDMDSEGKSLPVPNSRTIVITNGFIWIAWTGGYDGISLPAEDECERHYLLCEWLDYPGVRIMTLCESHAFLHERNQ